MIWKDGNDYQGISQEENLYDNGDFIPIPMQENSHIATEHTWIAIQQARISIL
jgi:hypothetical protein